jgi:YVTN family beta-propeller protein
MAGLPSGAVTFLFTDIEGSTRLLKRLREGYADVLAEHQRLLRATFASHRGHEVDTQGDSFFVAFASARDALLAAVDGQLTLNSHPWPAGVQIKVRMGLHTGQAALGDGRYTGLAVHRAARVGAAGHGGQILVTQATQTLLEDEEEDLHVFLRDLGEQRLKDLDRPVRLYQAVADGLPDSFPPLRHEAESAQAAAAATGPALWRRPVFALVALAVVCVLAAGAILGTRRSSGGLGEVRPNHVGLIDPKRNEIVAEIAVGIRPGPVATNGSAVWVGNLQDRTLSKINVRRRSPEATISLDNRTPTGLAVGSGAVWVAYGLRGQLSRVDPQFNQVTKPIEVASSSFGSQTGAVAVGAGSVWAVFGDSTLARIEPKAGRVTGSVTVGAMPRALVVGGGSLWVFNSGDATVDRFNPATFESGPTETKSVGSGSAGIAFGEGAVWVANTVDDTVTRIDPSTGSTRTISVGDGPVAIALGAGSVWVANASAGTVSRVDPVANKVVRTISLRSAPSGIVFVDGLVWVAAQAR